MRNVALAGAVWLALVAFLYAWWSVSVSPHVARVEASIAHHQQQLHQHDAAASLRVGAVEAAGFPFNPHVVLRDIALSSGWGGERYTIILTHAKILPVDAREGRYRVVLPEHVSARYETMHGEERYRVTPDQMPALLLRAQGDSRQCMNMPSTPRCADVAPDAPLISFAVQLPARLVLEVTSQHDETKKIGFQFMPVNMPIFQTIPPHASRNIQLFVGMLQEAYRH